MYVALLTAIVLLLASLPVLTGSHATPIATAAGRARINLLKPNVIENGSDVVTLPLQPQLDAYLQSNVAFSPDGTGYFVDESHAIVKVSPSGQYSSIAVARAFSLGLNSLIYARANLWVPVRNGIIRIDPTGRSRRFYDLALPGAYADAVGVAYGSDGNVYALMGDDYPGFGSTTWLYRIDIRGAVTGRQVPVSANPYDGSKFISGANGDFYTAYYSSNTGVKGIARIRFDGTATLYPTGTGGDALAYVPSSLTFSNGNVYFLVYSVAYVHENLVTTWYLKCLSATGISTLKTFAANEVPNSLAVDFGRNIWVTTTTLQAAPALYQYNVSNGAYTGPYLSLTNASGAIAVGADDNIWLPTQAPVIVGPTTYCCSFSGFTVFVRHVQTLEPAAITLSAAQAAQFTILETHANGPWTAVSQEPSIATVTPAVSATGAFTVSEVQPGSAQILVKDRLGNFSYETVTAR